MAVFFGLLAAAISALLVAPVEAIGVGLARTAFATAAVAVCAAMAFQRGDSLRALGASRSEPSTAVWLAPALAVAGWLTFNGLENSRLPWWPPQAGGVDPLIGLALIGLVGPAGEEIFFRGFVRQALQASLRPWAVIGVLTALGVGHAAIVHPGATPDLLVGLGVLAFILAAAAELLRLELVVAARLAWEALILAGGFLAA